MAYRGASASGGRCAQDEGGLSPDFRGDPWVARSREQILNLSPVGAQCIAPRVTQGQIFMSAEGDQATREPDLKMIRRSRNGLL
jgi:hypothetical protein